MREKETKATERNYQRLPTANAQLTGKNMTTPPLGQKTRRWDEIRAAALCYSLRGIGQFHSCILMSLARRSPPEMIHSETRTLVLFERVHG
jgi:hypothetical protein